MSLKIKTLIIFFITFVFIGINAVFATSAETNCHYDGGYWCSGGIDRCVEDYNECYDLKQKASCESVGRIYCSSGQCVTKISDCSTSSSSSSGDSSSSNLGASSSANSSSSSSSSGYSSTTSTSASGSGTVGLVNPLGASSFSEIMGAIATWLRNIALVLAPLMIVIGGIMFILAQGDPGKVTKAKQLILWSAIGLIVVLLAQSLTSILKGFIG